MESYTQQCENLGYVSWPLPGDTAAGPMQNGWRCGDCGTVLAPWVASHVCPHKNTTTVTSTANYPNLDYLAKQAVNINTTGDANT